MVGTPGANVTSQKRNVMVTKLNMVQQLSEAQQSRSNIVVAASGLTMADGQSQDPMLAQVRMRNGEYVYVKDLPAIDAKNRQPNGDYLIPLVTDHTGKVKEQVGAAWLFIENEMLHALVVWTNNQIANDIKPLADDGFLQFSTEGFVDDVDDNGKYGDFWISTLSPVTVGNDPATQVLNQHKKVLIANAFSAEIEGETPMPKKQNDETEVEETEEVEPAEEETTEEVENEITPEEYESLKQEIKAEILEELAGETTEETEEVVEMNDTQEIKNKVGTTPKTKVGNQTPKQNLVVVKNDMSSDKAFDAFVNAIRVAAKDGTDKSGVRTAMNAFKTQNAITGSAILPESIQSTFFKAWLDNENLTAFRFMNSKVGAVYAAATSDTALGHLKGEDKVEQSVALTRRDLKAVALYKKLVIDRQDLFDDESGELVRFRSQELASRITNQILVAALIGGTEEGSVNGTGGGGVRGLFGIIPDAAAGSGFGDIVASEVAGTDGESAYAAAVRTIGAIARTASGNITSSGRISSGITLFVPYSSDGNSWVTNFLLTTNENGGYLFPSGTDLEAILRVDNIIEVPELEASGSIIAIADGAYQLYGENSPEMYPFFDTTDNTDKLLAEQFVAGSLAGYKQAAVYVPYEAS